MDKTPVHFSVPLKSTGVTYLLWLFFGGIGAHKFYLGRPGVGFLYIVMFAFFWSGLIGLSVLAVANIVDAIILTPQQGTQLASRPASRLSDSTMLSFGMIVPMSVALLYDLFTIPSQVRTANDDLISAAHQISASPPASSRLWHAGAESEFSSQKADKMIARYLANQATTKPSLRSTGSTPPIFGRRGAEGRRS
jgi:TM2 domain-containing membrane protein YozV